MKRRRKIYWNQSMFILFSNPSIKLSRRPRNLGSWPLNVENLESDLKIQSFRVTASRAEMAESLSDRLLGSTEQVR